MSLALACLFAATGVTISFPPTRIGPALEQLSPQCGVTLKASPAIENEVLLAHLKDAPVDKVLARIAETLLAKWSTNPDGSRTLVPDPVAMKRRQDEFDAAARTVIEASFAYLKRALAKQPAELDKAFIERHKRRVQQENALREAANQNQNFSRPFDTSVEEESPIWRAAARIMLQLGPGVVAALPNDARVVYSDRPTPMQRPFPTGIDRILQQYRREQELLGSPAQPARYRLSIKRWETGGGSNVQLEAIDAAGEVINNALVRMNGDSELLKIPVNQRFPEGPDQRKVPIDSETREWRLMMRSNVRDQAAERGAALKKWRAQLLTPEIVEPTRHFAGTDLVGAAAVMDKNLIGTVFDLTSASYWNQPESPTVASILRQHRLSFTESPDGWIIVRPEESLTRTARDRAGQLIRSSVQRGGVSVDDAAKWVSDYPKDKWPFVGWIGDHLKVLLSGTGPYSALSTLLDSDSLRVWSSLGETSRAALRRGETLSVRSLTPAAQTSISRIAFWFEGVEGEPTEVLPRGVVDGTVSLSIQEKVIFSGWSSQEGEPEVLSPIDASSFGTYLVKGNTWWQVSADHYRQMDRFRMGLHRVYALKFRFLPGDVPMEVSLSESFFDPASKPVTSLPAPVLAEIEKARAKAAGASGS
jgi:hypothetical protein